MAIYELKDNNQKLISSVNVEDIFDISKANTKHSGNACNYLFDLELLRLRFIRSSQT